MTGSGGFDVEDDVVGFEEGADVEAFEFAVGDGCNGCIKFFISRQFIEYIEPVFTFNCGRICPRIEDGDIEVILLKSFDYVDNFGIANVGAVLFECKAEDYDVATKHLDAFLEHEFDDTVSHVGAHAVVHAATGEYDFGIIAIALCALCEIVRVDTDTVSAYQTRLERKKIPLG